MLPVKWATPDARGHDTGTLCMHWFGKNNDSLVLQKLQVFLFDSAKMFIDMLIS